MLETLRKGAGTWIAKIFIALLVMSFAVWGIADIFGGFSGRDIATVGKTKISAEAFRKAYEAQISNLSSRFGRRLTAKQAQQLGIDQQVLANLIGEAALNQQAEELKLGISDKAIAENIQNDPSFRGLDGKFSRTRFNELIRMNGLSEQGYVFGQRDVQVRNQIINSLFSSIKLPKTYINAVEKFSQEKRVVKYFKVPVSRAGKIAAPDDEALKKFFEARPNLFTAPEFRKIGMLIVQPSKVKATIKVTDEEIKTAYDASADRFNEPEKRRVQQIAFADPEKAKKVYAELKKGKNFDKVAEKNGFSKAEIDLGLIKASVLADKKIREAAFALKAGKISEPIKGELATVILKVSKIVPPVKGSFAKAKSKLKDEMLLDRAQNKIQDMLDQIEDERAGGATLNEIATKLQAEYRLIEAVNSTGNDANGNPVKDVIESAKVLRTAFSSDIGVETEAIEIGEGGYQWVEVLDVTPRKLKDFANIKEGVKTEYMKVEKASVLRKFAVELTNRLKNGEPMNKVARSAGQNVKTAKPLKRGDSTDVLTKAVVNQAFTLTKDGFGNGSGIKADTRIVFQVTNIIAPEARKPEETEKMRSELSQSLLSDMLAQFVGGLQTHYNVNINQDVFKRLTGRDQS